MRSKVAVEQTNVREIKEIDFFKKGVIKIYQKMYIDNFIARRSLTTTTFKNLALKKEENLFSACHVLTHHVLKS